MKKLLVFGIVCCLMAVFSLDAVAQSTKGCSKEQIEACKKMCAEDNVKTAESCAKICAILNCPPECCQPNCCKAASGKATAVNVSKKEIRKTKRAAKKAKKNCCATATSQACNKVNAAQTKIVSNE